MFVGPTTVTVRVSGLVPGPHGFHLVSFSLGIFSCTYAIPFSKSLSNLCYFLLQHEYGDLTNGCLSTGILKALVSTFSYHTMVWFC